MKIIDDIEQLSQQWFELRAGMPTASYFDMILTPTGQPSKQAKKYMYQLAGEQILGQKTETYQSQAMLEGIEQEKKARLYFEMEKDVEVRQVALCINDEETYGCSPDGLLERSGLEIKCPQIHTHVEYLLENKLPTIYIPQIQGSMLVTGVNSWWFMSYYSGLDPLIIKIKRDNEYCIKLKVELEMFCEKLTETVSRLRGMG